MLSVTAPVLFIRPTVVKHELNQLWECMCVSVCVCRSVAVRLEMEVGELRRNLQQAVDHKLEAECEKQEAQNKVNHRTPDPGDRD